MGRNTHSQGQLSIGGASWLLFTSTALFLYLHTASVALVIWEVTMSQHTLTQHPPMSIHSAIREGTTNLQFNTGSPVALLSPGVEGVMLKPTLHDIRRLCLPEFLVLYKQETLARRLGR